MRTTLETAGVQGKCRFLDFFLFYFRWIADRGCQHASINIFWLGANRGRHHNRINIFWLVMAEWYDTYERTDG